MPVYEDGDVVIFDIFVDRSSVEIISSEGMYAMTNLVYPEQPYNKIEVISENGTTKVRSLKAYSLNIK